MSTLAHVPRLVRRSALAGLAVAAATLLAAPVAEARITRIEITSVESPTFEGRTFGPSGSVGAYEKLRGVAHGEVDPNDPLNEVITDIKLAPRNARGMVEYNMDFWISKPLDMTRANGTLLHDVPNRGRVRSLEINVGGAGDNNAGDGFLQREGYTLADNGWGETSPPGCRSACPWRGTRTAARSPAAYARNTSKIRRRARRT